MNKSKFDKNITSLLETIVSLDGVREMEKFLRDLCTIEELKVMSERWAIAKMLNDGFSYRKISQSLGASTTTVSRVASWLNNGEGGYVIALNKKNLHHNPPLISGKS